MPNKSPEPTAVGACSFAVAVHVASRRWAQLSTLGIMKIIALKAFVSLFAAFAAYYTYFIGSVFRDLFFPAPHHFCGTGDVWALEGAAIFFAPPALLGSVGLWFVGRQRQTVGVSFSRASRVSLIILVLCAIANLVIFIPTL